MIGKTNAIAQTGIDTSDATALIDDVALGKTAYVNGKKITGTNRCKEDFIAFIEGSSTHLTVPYGTKVIASNKFFQAPYVSISLPDTIITIDNGAFSQSSIVDINIPYGVTYLGQGAFSYMPIKEINLPETIWAIETQCFVSTQLESITIPASVSLIGTHAFGFVETLKRITFKGTSLLLSNPFVGCTAVEEVYLPNGFNSDGLNVAASTLFTAEMVASWGPQLADRTGLPTFNFIMGPENIKKLSDEQIAIYVTKNWTLS